MPDCKCCGLNEVEIDTIRGASVCIGCGAVLEESAVVSEVQFEENAHGVSSAVGQFVADDSSGVNNSIRKLGKFFRPTSRKENRETTVLRAKKTMQFIAKQLQIADHMIEQSLNFYRMILCRELTRGRRSFLICAACLYTVCRLERTPHLLIDFCDLLQLNIFILARTCWIITRELSLSLPYTDPCIYLMRYANQLNFDEKTHDVYVTALRILKRMKRDSLHYGRVPAGLCGAALLLSARYHNFHRQLKDVVKVVRIHETTLKKRLEEFGRTPSSDLSVDVFMNDDLKDDQDPPSFRAAHLKDVRHIDESGREYRKKLRLLERIIDKYVDRRLSTKHNNLDEHIDRVLEDEREFTINDVITTTTNTSSPDDDFDNVDDDKLHDSNNSDIINNNNNNNNDDDDNNVVSVKKLFNTTDDGKIIDNDNSKKKNEDVDAADENAARLILESKADDLDSYESDDENDPIDPALINEWERADDIGLGPTHESLGFGKDTCKNKNSDDIIAASNEGVRITLNPNEKLSDEDCSLYILNEFEREAKLKIWQNTYASYLDEKKAKDLLVTNTVNNNTANTNATRATVRRKKSSITDNTISGPSELIENALKAKKISTKLNYDVLKTLDLPDFADWQEKRQKKMTETVEDENAKNKSPLRRPNNDDNNNNNNNNNDNNNKSISTDSNASELIINNRRHDGTDEQQTSLIEQNSKIKNKTKIDDDINNRTKELKRRIRKLKKLAMNDNDDRRRRLKQQVKKLKKLKKTTINKVEQNGRMELNDDNKVVEYSSCSEISLKEGIDDEEEIGEEEDIADDEEEESTVNRDCLSSVMELMRNRTSDTYTEQDDDVQSYYSDF